MKKLTPATALIASVLALTGWARGQTVRSTMPRAGAPAVAAPGATFDYGAMINDFGYPIMMDLQSVIDDYMIYKEQIELTPDQVASLKKLRDEYQKEIVRLNSALDVATLKLSNVLYEDKIDAKEVGLLSAEISRLEGEIRTDNISTFIAARNILSADQLKKAAGQGVKFYPFEYLGYRRLFH